MEEAFEKWWEEHGVKSNGFSYDFEIIEESFKEVAWKAWQASWVYLND